ncbi:tetratricopeptide repeat-containing sulfotransferase family protein [Mangrovicoccus algicola]|uniref:Sulfotransferase n=1 Tax=Mangrovicoccus algicola TaxID=2771008 RepID=A0A8J6YXA9_9RHOB|nr:sulfotransferase [Mangrovicoccus algicola]MBE3638059.1 sulfotransferase [Mangrovicoccus algicola]
MAAETVESVLRRARSLDRAGAPGRAAELYLGVLARHPGNRRARAALQRLTTRTAPEDRRRIGATVAACRALLRANRAEAAREMACAALSDGPHLQDLHTLMAELLAAAGQHDAALAHLMTARQLAPRDPGTALNLARLLSGMGRFAETAELCAAILVARPDDLPALALSGAAHVQLGQPARARACLDRAIALRPGDAGLHLQRAELHLAAGDGARAEADIAAGLRADPGRAELIHLACRSATRPPGDPLCRRAAQRLREPGLPRRDEAFLCFALARQMHAAGDRAGAFAHWARGNAAWRAETGYDPREDIAEFTRMRRIAAAGFGAIRPAPPSVRIPVFVIGLPRSGTTLAEQILASHPQVHGAGERDALPAAIHMDGPPEAPPDAARLNRIRTAYLEALAATTPPARYVVDKMPSNFLYLPWILAAFPEARVIRMRRDPVAVCWSNFRNFFPQGGRGTGFAQDLRDLALYHGLYAEMIGDWDTRFPGRMRVLDYEALCADQRGETARLLSDLDLPWDPACLEFHRTRRLVTTCSAEQVRRPIYPGASQEWRDYAPWLGPLLSGLAAAEGAR